MKPVIGITCSEDDTLRRYHLNYPYCLALEAFGAVPVMLPDRLACVEEYVRLVDGILLSGGVDVDPFFFGEEPLKGMGEMTPARDVFEVALVKRLLHLDKPVFAVCRGVQVLNIAAGGDIFQDLDSQCPDSIRHRQLASREYPSHEVAVVPGTLLACVLQVDKLRVNSFHHQAVRQAAPGFTINARASDGVIEGIECTQRRFVLGVQWHPECSWQQDQGSQRLFQSFVKAST